MAADPRPQFVVPPAFYRATWQYRCPFCDTRLEFDTAEVMGHVDTRMPVCCGRVMELTALAEPAGTAG